MMYFGLLRVLEVADGYGSYPILAKDVHIGRNKKKMLLILCSSKTHGKHNDPQLVKISSISNKNQQYNDKAVKSDKALPCPYQLLWKFSSIRGGFKCDTELFFVFSDKSALSA